MKRILVAYASMAGSTAEVARVVAEQIARPDVQVDVLPLSAVTDLTGYDGVVVGGPMIMGWHRGALRFLRKHRAAFQRIPLAVFVMCMSLTQSCEASVDGVPVSLDEALPTPPETEGRLRLRERYARLGNYVRPILRASGRVKPVSIGVFAGRLDYGRLPWWGCSSRWLSFRREREIGATGRRSAPGRRGSGRRCGSRRRWAIG